MKTPKTPKVLISHAHHDELHKAKVKKLYTALRLARIDADIDIVHSHNNNQKWIKWMKEKLDMADFVLMICTEEYYRKANDKNKENKGHGVYLEIAIAEQEIYFEKFENRRFVPIIFGEKDKAYIPKLFKDYTAYYIDIEVDDLHRESGFLSLYRKLRNIPEDEVVPLGEELSLEPDIGTKKLAVIFQEEPIALETFSKSRESLESLLRKIQIKRYFKFDFRSAMDLEGYSRFLKSLHPIIVHHIVRKGNPLFAFQGEVFKGLPFNTNCFIIQNYTPNSQEEQVKMLIRYIEYVIGLPGTLDQEKTNHFLSKFYEEFFMEKPANLAFVHGAYALGEELLKGPDSPLLITQKNNEMVQYKGLEQIKELEREMEKLAQEETFLDSQISVYKTKYLEGNPYKAMILWLTNYQKQFLADIGAEFFNSYQISNKEDFLLELEFLIERLITCLYTKRLNIVFKENLKTMRISNPSLFYQVALSKLDIEIEKAKVDENSKSFFRSAVDKLFKELAG